MRVWFKRMCRKCVCPSVCDCAPHPLSWQPAGKLWGHQLFGVEPDIMTLAKPLAGGLPIGACLMKQHVADVMKPGALACGHVAMRAVHGHAMSLRERRGPAHRTLRRSAGMRAQ